MFNIASKEAMCKDGSVSWRYKVQATDFILKTAKTATNAMVQEDKNCLKHENS